MVQLVKPARNHSSRREQWRLLLLILPLGLVILLMARIRDPQTADRINRFFAPIKPRPVVAGSPAPNVRTEPRDLFPGIRREPLASIKDNTYFRNSETQAWFHFFDVLQRTPLEQISSAHGVEVDYTQLIDQPETYRGRLVSIKGTVRQVTRQTPAPNDLGIDSYDRVVIQPADGVPWPIFVYCLEMDADRPERSALMGSVQVTGLFFKNLSYSWQDGLGTAPVLVSRSLNYSESTTGAPNNSIRAPIVTDDWTDVERQDESKQHPPTKESAEQAASFRDVLKLAGWSAERLAQFDDSQALSVDQRPEAVELLRRLRSFDSSSLEEWAHKDAASHVLANPAEFRGELIRLSGRVTAVTKHRLHAEDAERLEMPAYFGCAFELDDAEPVTVLATRVPRAWLQMHAPNEPATAKALLLKRPSNDSPAEAVWLAKEVAWHPSEAKEPFVSFGESLLGRLGMDVGLLDNIRSRGRIRSAEREAFYQMLDAAGRIGPQQLVRFAEGNLAAIEEKWRAEERQIENDETKLWLRLMTTVGADWSFPLNVFALPFEDLSTFERKLAGLHQRRMLAREVRKRADEGRYSVAPLFNDPDSQIGQLIVVDGAARRVVRVDVGSRPEAEGPSDVARRFGIDQYYEMEVFTDDSQNYPLVFCVRELPAGFPTGSSIHIPIRVAGFFFKDWLYHPRGSGLGDAAGGRGQYAPLLIGRAPLVLAIEHSGKDTSQLVFGVLFVAALGGIWAVAAWFARGDRRFRESVLAERFSLPPGQSLNEINLSPVDEPMKK